MRWRKLTKEENKKMGIARRGIKFTEEHKAKIGASLKGKKRGRMSMEEKIKRSLGQTKEKVFTGFKSKERTRVQNSSEYAQWRNFVFRRDNHTCFYCKKRGGRLEAHHKFQFAFFPEMRLNYANGTTVCKGCHSKIPAYKTKQYAPR